MAEITNNTTNNNRMLSEQVFNSYQELIAESVSLSVLNTNKTPLGFDAWGRNKTITDFSLFHGVFTYNVPSTKWVKYENSLEVATSTQMTSNFGKLVVNSGLNSAYIRSRRHPRYQPNRGHLYSSSCFLPSPQLLGERNFGIFTQENGVFFRLKNGVLYAVVRTKNATVQEQQYLINVPDTCDLSKGNVYDIQMQWRGVGNIYFFINQQLVVSVDYLGTLDELSISNPALPIAFESINGGDEVELYCGCADVTSEGGSRVVKQYRSVTSGETSLSVAEQPVIALTISETIGGSINTRDIILQSLEGYCDGAALLRVYATRDSTAFTMGSPVSINDGFQTISLNGNVTAIDYAKMVKLHEKRIPAGGNAEIVNKSPDDTEFYITRGDYILVTIQAKNNTLGGATLAFGEEV